MITAVFTDAFENVEAESAVQQYIQDHQHDAKRTLVNCFWRGQGDRLFEFIKSGSTDIPEDLFHFILCTALWKTIDTIAIAAIEDFGIKTKEEFVSATTGVKFSNVIDTVVSRVCKGTSRYCKKNLFETSFTPGCKACNVCNPKTQTQAKVSANKKKDAKITEFLEGGKPSSMFGSVFEKCNVTFDANGACTDELQACYERTVNRINKWTKDGCKPIEVTDADFAESIKAEYGIDCSRTMSLLGNDTVPEELAHAILYKVLKQSLEHTFDNALMLATNGLYNRYKIHVTDGVPNDGYIKLSIQDFTKMYTSAFKEYVSDEKILIRFFNGSLARRSLTGIRRKCNCSRGFLDSVFFIGQKSATNNCFMCRDKCAKNDKRLERRRVRNERARVKGYQKAYRARKLAEDPVGYRTQLASNQKTWCDENREHVRDYRNNNFYSRLYSLKYEARSRRVEWGVDLTDEMCYKMITGRCTYCNIAPDEKDLQSLHGIDRIDNTIGYTVENTTGCCGTCNNMKLTYSRDLFVIKCNQVSKHNGSEYRDFPHGIIRRGGSVSRNAYSARAEKKELAFEITEEFNILKSQDCKYCGQPGPNGIDRIDNTGGYTSENATSCCTMCNYMKKNLSESSFIEKCKAIAAHYDHVPDIEKVRLESPMITKKKSPVRKNATNDRITVDSSVAPQPPKSNKSLQPMTESPSVSLRPVNEGSFKRITKANSSTGTGNVYTLANGAVISAPIGVSMRKSGNRRGPGWEISAKYSVTGKVKKLTPVLKPDEDEETAMRERLAEILKSYKSF